MDKYVGDTLEYGNEIFWVLSSKLKQKKKKHQKKTPALSYISEARPYVHIESHG